MAPLAMALNQYMMERGRKARRANHGTTAIEMCTVRRLAMHVLCSIWFVLPLLLTSGCA